MLHDLDTA
jgi:chromosome segregation ATPase